MSFYGGFFFPLIDSAKIRKIFLYTKNLDKKRWFMMILDKIDSKKDEIDSHLDSLTCKIEMFSG